MSQSPVNDHIAVNVDLISQDALADDLETNVYDLVVRGQAKNSDEFKPKLMILLATPDYCRPQLLNGIRRATQFMRMQDLPLIGGSTEAFIHAGRLHRSGAVLITLATDLQDLIEVVDVKDFQCDDTELLAKYIEESSKKNPNRQILNINFWPYLDDTSANCGEILSSGLAERLDKIRQESRTEIQFMGGGCVRTQDSPSGVQFMNGRIVTQRVVSLVAAVDLTHASGAESPLRPHGVSVRPQGMHDDSSVSFEDIGVRSAVDFDSLPQPFALQSAMKPWRVISAISTSKNKLWTAQALNKDIFNIVTTTGVELVRSNKRLTKRLYLKSGASRSSVAFVLGLRDINRYALSKILNFDFEKRLKKHENGSWYVSAFMHSPLGTNCDGQVFSSAWNSAQLILWDELSIAAQERRLVSALNKHMFDTTVSHGVPEAMGHSLKALQHAGYGRAMISLIYEVGEDRWIVAYQASGKNWHKVVRPKTRRPLNDKAGASDILASITKQESGIYIHNAQYDDRCDNGLASEAGVVSFYVSALRGTNQSAFGTLQIGLGDRRKRRKGYEPSSFQEDVQGSPPPGSIERLNVLTQLVASSLACAIQREQLKTARHVDDILTACMTQEKTTKAAIERFVREAAETIEIQEAHVRIFNHESKTSELYAGIGAYYEAAKLCRTKLARDDASEKGVSSSLNAYDRQLVVVNNTRLDEKYQEKIARYQNTPLAGPLAETLSYANAVIIDSHGAAIGVLSFGSRKDWFFTQSKINSLLDIAQRLSTLLMHRQAKEEIETRQRRQQFLLEISTRITQNEHGYRALKRQVACIRQATQAHTAALYLRDEVKDKLVLRAQDGWHTGDLWLDAAAFPDDSIVHNWLREAEPEVFHSLAVGDHFQVQMFAHNSSFHLDCSVISIPLYYWESDPVSDSQPRNTTSPQLVGNSEVASRLKQLGILLLYGPGEGSRHWAYDFDQGDRELLHVIQEVVTTNVAAIKATDRLHWEQNDLQLRSQVSRQIFEPGIDQGTVRERFANILIDPKDGYGFKEVCIYKGSTPDGLRPATYLKRLKNGKLIRSRSQISKSERDLVRTTFRRAQSTHSDHPTPDWENGLVEWKEPEPKDSNDVEACRMAGWVTQMAAPLYDAAHKPSGAVFIRWQRMRKSESYNLLPMHSKSGLSELVRRLSVALQLKQITEDGLIAAVSIAGMGLELTDDYHVLVNTVSGLSKKLSALELKLRSSEPKGHYHLEAEAEKCLTITSRLKSTVERITRAQYSLANATPENFDVANLIRSILHSMERKYTNRHLKLDTEQINSVQCHGIESHIRVALKNIISNAVHYAQQHSTINIGCRLVDAHCHVLVANVGQFDEREINKHMQHSVDPTIDGIKRTIKTITPELHGKKGLGISTARLILQLSGGDLAFEPKGNRAVFNIKIGKAVAPSQTSSLQTFPL